MQYSQTKSPNKTPGLRVLCGILCGTSILNKIELCNIFMQYSFQFESIVLIFNVIFISYAFLLVRDIIC